MAIVSNVDARMARTRRRLSRADRERQIVDGAIAFFAEAGLDGQTRELARRLGITQPLLYRYFPRKEDLIERIYEEVYLKRWKPEWEVLIGDRSLPVGERLRRFEKDYQRTIMTHDWLRIFVSAGHKGYDLPRRYLARVRERIFAPALRDLRREYGLPSADALPLGEPEFELMYGLHGALIYVGIRRFIYGSGAPTDPEPVFDAQLDAFLGGVGPVLRRLVAEQEAVRAARP